MLTILAIAAALTLGVAAPAWADTTVSLDPARLPLTAAEYASNSVSGRVGLSTCDIAPATASDRDVWIFHATGAPDPVADPSGSPEPTTSAQPTPTSGGVLIGLSATFATAETITVDSSSSGTDGGIVDDSAWIGAPAGSVLTAASAKITTGSGTLELVTACPARPVATADPLVGLLPSATSTAPPAATTDRATASPQTLPVAGTDVVSIAALGAGLVLTGVLLILAHGRRPKFADDPDEDDIRQPVVMIRRF